MPASGFEPASFPTTQLKKLNPKPAPRRAFFHLLLNSFIQLVQPKALCIDHQPN